MGMLAEYGIRAYYDLSTAGVEDSELAEALRMVWEAGNIKTHEPGNQLFGKVASNPMTSSEAADMRRSGFKVVK